MSSQLTTRLADGRTLRVRVIRHPRYRRIRLSIRTDGSVQLSAPRSARAALLSGFLKQQEPWLRRHVPSGAIEPSLPSVLKLRALNEDWRVQYTSQAAGQSTAERILSVSAPERSTALAGLQGWLRERAGQELGPWLQELSEATGLPYAKLTIRGQRSRWGSYSPTGNVSLNFRLLFLPPELVSYVLIHELCHARHLNHSAAYWAEVARHEPRVNELRKRMRTAAAFVPDWLSLSGRR